MSKWWIKEILLALVGVLLAMFAGFWLIGLAFMLMGTGNG